MEGGGGRGPIHARSPAPEAFSENLGAPAGRTRPPAVALAPPQARKHAHDAGQPAARAGHEPGAVPKEKAVLSERSRGTPASGAGSLGQSPARRTSETARPTRTTDRGVGSRRS